MKYKDLLQNHPLHPALVHFPIACWSLATIGDVASAFVDVNVWWVSGLFLVIGSLTAIATMLSGLLEITKIDEHSPAMQIVNLHIKLVIISWSLYSISLFLRFEENSLSKPNLLEICLSLTGFFFLCAAGWFGAMLVYKYKVGVKN